jgi:hypothetical protein
LGQQKIGNHATVCYDEPGVGCTTHRRCVEENMKIIRGFPVLAACLVLFDLAWAGQNPGKQKKVLEVGKGININTELNKNDNGYCDTKKHAKFFLVQFAKGKTYQIDMVSTKFDSFLYLEDSKKMVVAQDDDSGGMLNALIQFKAPADGVYRVIATSFNGTQTGPFNLRIEEKPK